MKRTLLNMLKKTGLLILLGLLIYGIKFTFDLSFSGTEDIKIVKDYDSLLSIEELIDQPAFKNKVLYIDIWGVYCKPCINQFRLMPAIKKQLKNEAVEFIYISTPYGYFNDEQLWKAAIKKYKLKGYHVHASMQFYENIWEEVEGIEDKWSIPHYLLVDKDGKIANPNAPAPIHEEALLAELT
ncbi:MAG: hypothetical protein D6730_22510, partial [Bacteroidetes bacterium]